MPFDIYFKQEYANNYSGSNFIISPNDIKYFIEEIILKTVETKDIFDGKKDSIVNLFIWCLLYNRFEIAKILLPMLQVFLSLFMNVLDEFNQLIDLTSNQIHNFNRYF